MTLTLAEYAGAKRLPLEFLRELGLREEAGSLLIPYRDQDGREIAVRHRLSMNGSRTFAWPKGTPAKGLVYGLDRWKEARAEDYALLVEGESDAQTAWLQGIPAFGIPGAGMFDDELTTPCLEGISTLYVVEEPDEGGAAFIAALRSSRLAERIRVLRLPDGVKDLSALHLEVEGEPKAFRHAVVEAVSRAMGEAPLRVVALPEAAQAGLIAVPAEQFAAVDEPSATPILGDAETTVLAAGGTIVAYGDGGAGKTTLLFDCAMHLAAGRDWLGLPVPHPCRVLWIEDEGPRGKFREKVRTKLAAWDGPPLEGRLIILEAPWGLFTFAEEPHRRGLIDLVRTQEIDVLIAGPVNRLGVEGGGTPAEVQAFLRLLDELRAELDRPLAYGLIHHENKAGDVSGAWEGAPDTLVHVQARGNGHTAVRWQKVRWGSELHGKGWRLLWRPGESFELDETPETTDEDIAEKLIQAVRENPGASWNAVEGAANAKAERRRAIRDQLLERALIVNAGTDRAMRLFLPGDPELGLLRPERDALGTHLASDRGGEGEMVQVRPASQLYRDAGTDAPTSTPREPAGEDAHPDPEDGGW